MTNEQAIDVIKSNWPDERYTILKDALTLALIALSDSKEWRKPDESTPHHAPVWIRFDDEWTLFPWTANPETLDVVLAKENQGPPPDDYRPKEKQE